MIYSIVFIILMLWFNLYSTPVPVTSGVENDVIGRMCQFSNGNILAVIERNPDWNSGDLYSIISTDDGNTWGTLHPAVINSGNQSTFSLISLPGDTFMLFYASNEGGAYKIYRTQSTDGINWIPQGQINLGWQSGQSVYDPIVIRENDNSLTMTYIAMGYGAYVAHQPWQGQWDSLKTQVQANAYRARICRHADGTYMAAYHRRTGSTYEYDVFVKTSPDRLNWSGETQLTTNKNSHDPFCGIAPDGAYLVFYAKYTVAYNLYYRRAYVPTIWETEVPITSDAVNNTEPSFYSMPNYLYLIWTHAVNYQTDNDIYFEKIFYTCLGVEHPPHENTSMNSSVTISQKHQTITINFSSSCQGNYPLKIYNISGQMIFQDNIQANGTANVTYDLGHLSPNIYFLKLGTVHDSMAFSTIYIVE
ncbi:MAG: hypothetical protein APR63_05645 [Desulfuromonas sp. SDB]|nr:MAG: hypothetical protein APR63_05645 [Desulfuromonas sp. SDB]